MKSFNQFYEQAGRLIPGGPYSSEKPAPSPAGNEPKEGNTQSKKSPRMVPPKKPVYGVIPPESPEEARKASRRAFDMLAGG